MHVGSVLDDRFELEALIATGGMGAIFRAIDRRTGLRVALKTLQTQMQAFQDRFVREANILGSSGIFVDAVGSLHVATIESVSEIFSNTTLSM